MTKELSDREFVEWCKGQRAVELTGESWSRLYTLAGSSELGKNSLCLIAQLRLDLAEARAVLEIYANRENWVAWGADDKWDCDDEENWNGWDAADRALSVIDAARKGKG